MKLEWLVKGLIFPSPLIPNQPLPLDHYNGLWVKM